VKRIVIPELLDSDSGTPAEIAASLADLRAINRRFGGITTTCGMIERAVAASGKKHLALLDVGAADGESLAECSRRLAERGIAVDYTLLDRVANHLHGGSLAAPALVGDALALPFAAGSFDLVACSLFAHHLEEEEIVTFVRRALEIARIAVLINDIRRSAFHLAFVRLALPSFASRLTKHDAPVSIRRAYTTSEMAAMLQRVGAARVDVTNHFFFRMAAIAWSKNTASN